MLTQTQKTNAALMDRRRAAIPRGVGQSHEVFIARGVNAEVWDVEGKRYIDFAGGIAVLNTGHCHPEIMQAVKDQIDLYTHTCFQVLAYEPYVELAERINALAPGNFAKKTMFLTTGAEAVENAIKIARSYTKRSAVIAFTSGYHGRTLLTLGLTGKVAPYKTGFGPFPGEIFHAQFPNAAHGVSVDDSIASIESIFKNDVEASRVAAIIVEPVQGEGGFNVAPTEFLQRLRALCDQHGILMIADEIQTGAGRTGTWFAMEQSGVAPDMITMAKSMAGGYPISGVVGRAEVMDAPAAGGLGGTYAGSPIACAAALAVLDVFEKGNLLERSRQLGAHMMNSLKTMAGKYKCVADVRGLGAMVAIELCKNGDPHQPNAEMAKALASEATQRGLILLTCGTYGNVVRILVPLTASDAIVDEGLAIIDACLAAVQ
ncbi:MAG: 4-aminobutyrate--2-oxoglutarate transaminase [Rhodoferax sp.]|uniref:4-aminobutyrate--2-oxoglutarate transaminase n=1 Tax=Rhodoferax sp. TaxID=50421 RepID=UPI0008D2F6EA|nr:4-aminobutyrate--2-oxoglutarate transaminase [Rhodoferax sp.]MDP2678661.1 4-aminobutyrate--2-oxoglutarate transaminase [Rhodoferax sp.]OGB44213.1 MAG: 4-aminobutyrate transaminase [Burkholderiales bacterium RIFOXYC2_FULL_59_8]OGB58146.1 MAG: 4-aminobutyrate transaminase [Burkholderiales bacterium RIFOXYD12_FULL_59_19]OGB82395.1 MAG: 4-aminobutyrate transaminase [Burkholderiales bacterium RIFOXYC12_FULL_60_6]